MKRSVAFLLMLVLTLSLVPGVAAAEGETVTVLRADFDEPALSTSVLLNALETQKPAEGEEYFFFMPTFEMYGMTVLSGESMNLRGCFRNGNKRMRIAAVVYEGTYEELTAESEAVGSGQKLITSSNSTNTGTYFKWDTTGLPEGDYTAIYAMLDPNNDDEIVYAAVCDLFLSDEEIPLERIGLYIFELGREVETVYCRPGHEVLTYGFVRHPYHTTDRRKILKSGDGFGFGSSNFENGDGMSPPGEIGTHQFYFYVNNSEIRSTVDFIVEEDVGQFPKILPLTDAHICYGQERGFEILLPEGFTLNDALVQFNGGNAAELTRVEGNVLYLKGMQVNSVKWRFALTVAVNDRFAVQDIAITDHEFTADDKAPTCTEGGWKAYQCGNCGCRYGEELPALGHDIAQTTIVTEPKATKDGITVGYCARCDQDVEEVIPRIFTDTQPDWFYSDPLDYCYEEGIINGLSANTFGPTATLNRAQLVTMLYRHADSPAVEGESTFADVPAGQFYTDPVAWANANGIVKGYEDNSFRPGNPITRQEIVTMLHRYVVSLGRDNGERNDLSAFTDLDMLHEYAKDPMQWAVANGVINGLSETVLGPQEHANRAQTVTILYRIITGILEAE